MLKEDEITAVAIVRQTLADSIAPDLEDAALLSLPTAELSIDSLVKLELILELEKAFEVVLDEVEVARCRTLGDLVRLATISGA